MNGSLERRGLWPTLVRWLLRMHITEKQLLIVEDLQAFFPGLQAQHFLLFQAQTADPHLAIRSNSDHKMTTASLFHLAKGKGLDFGPVGCPGKHDFTLLEVDPETASAPLHFCNDPISSLRSKITPDSHERLTGGDA